MGQFHFIGKTLVQHQLSKSR